MKERTNNKNLYIILHVFACLRKVSCCNRYKYVCYRHIKATSFLFLNFAFVCSKEKQNYYALIDFPGHSEYAGEKNVTSYLRVRYRHFVSSCNLPAIQIDFQLWLLCRAATPKVSGLYCWNFASRHIWLHTVGRVYCKYLINRYFNKLWLHPVFKDLVTGEPMLTTSK